MDSINYLTALYDRSYTVSEETDYGDYWIVNHKGIPVMLCNSKEEADEWIQKKLQSAVGGLK